MVYGYCTLDDLEGLVHQLGYVTEGFHLGDQPALCRPNEGSAYTSAKSPVTNRRQPASLSETAFSPIDAILGKYTIVYWS